MRALRVMLGSFKTAAGRLGACHAQLALSAPRAGCLLQRLAARGLTTRAQARLSARLALRDSIKVVLVRRCACLVLQARFAAEAG